MVETLSGLKVSSYACKISNAHAPKSQNRAAVAAANIHNDISYRFVISSSKSWSQDYAAGVVIDRGSICDAFWVHTVLKLGRGLYLGPGL